jgi:hypothetical protein
MTSELVVDDLEVLQEQLRGDVWRPGDGGYDAGRGAWNLSVEQRPALVVMAENVGDVAAAVRYAAAHGLGVAVQATGHGVVIPANDALLLNVSRMNGVQIDPGAKTAWVPAGAKWGDVLGPAQAHGLAPLLGSSPGVGAVGYTLGGGMGWLVRKYGLASDDVRWFEVVTADGRVQKASADENSDLFWALRGGKGGFAVVTGMEIDLHPLEMVYGGNLIYPAAQAPDLLRRFRDWIAGTPEELTASIALMNLPPIEDIPEPLRGQSVVMVRGCYCGPVAEGEQYFAQWRAETEPLMDMVGPLPFAQVAMISMDPEGPVPGLSSGTWLADLSDETLDTLISHAFVAQGPPPLMITEVRYVGGAKGRVDAAGSAMGHRDAALVLQMVGMTPTPEIWGMVRGYMDGFLAALDGHKAGVYPNFVEGEEAVELMGDGFAPETAVRLRAVKARVDPENLFRYGAW